MSRTVPKGIPDPSVARVAAELDVHESTVYRWLKQGLFPGAYRVGQQYRIPREAVAAFCKPVASAPDLSLERARELGEQAPVLSDEQVAQVAALLRAD